MSSIVVKNLHASVNGQEIVRGVDLEFSKGEVHAVMGPNGSGKSTLAKVMAGHPDYEVTEGDILLDGESILEMEADERARKGLFLAFQYPIEIPGVSNANFLRAALQSRLPEEEELDATDFYQRLYQKMDLLEIRREFTARSVNEGFSGGEKKRNEILQLAMLEPAFAVLDETDSGLDIDALQVEAKEEPDWIREFRRNAYQVFKSKPLPTHWAGNELNEINFDIIRYYLASGDAPKRSWEDVPEEMKRTFERLGIPESERKFLAGVEAQFDSEAVYSNIKKAVSVQGVIFVGSTEGLKEHPESFL